MLRVMTYNIHSCKGMDNDVNPLRTAEIIALYQPDIAALQEVRVGHVRPETVDKPELARTGQMEPPVGQPPLTPLEALPKPPQQMKATHRPYVNQPEIIAQAVGMKSVFYPLVRLKGEDYGIAILSRYPMKLIRASNLPTLPKRPLLEKRGAIWVSVLVNGQEVQILNTHLGLSRLERKAQVEALLGPEWMGHPEFRQPYIMCGDWNARPSHQVYRAITKIFDDAQALAAGHAPRKTWPSSFPFFAIDHIFVPKGAKVPSACVPRTRLTKVNSDHLPLLADIVVENGGQPIDKDLREESKLLVD